MIDERKPYLVELRRDSLRHERNWTTFRQPKLGDRYNEVSSIVKDLGITDRGYIQTPKGSWQVWYDQEFEIASPAGLPKEVAIGAGLYKGWEDERQHLLVMVSDDYPRFNRAVRVVTERLIEREGGPSDYGRGLHKTVVGGAVGGILLGTLEGSLTGQPGVGGTIFGAIGGAELVYLAKRIDVGATKRRIPDLEDYWADENALVQLIRLTNHINRTVPFNELLSWLIKHNHWQGYDPNQVWKIYRTSPDLRFLANDRLRERRSLRLGKRVEEVAIKGMGEFVLKEFQEPIKYPLSADRH